MKTLIFKTLLPFLLLAGGMARGQTIVTTAVSASACPGEIVIPVAVTNCNGIGAIALMLNYNNAVLTFAGYQNLHPSLSGGMLVINSNGTKVVFGWANTSAANVGNDTLVELRFTGVTGTSSLTWDTQTQGNCEYSDINGNVLPASYANGTASIYQVPQINTQPTDKTVLTGQNTSFTLSAVATGIAYRWQLSSDGGNIWNDLSNNATYSGVTAATLTITNVQLSLNGNQYRCRISGTCAPEVYSDTVTLTVIYPVTTTLPTTSICPGNAVIPVTVTNFANVSAFSLTFAYNTSNLVYTGFQTLNGTLASGNFAANATGGKVYLTWASTTPVTFGDGTIVELLFTSSTGSSALTWDTQTQGNCEYTEFGGGQITSVFVNGNLTIYGIPAIVTNPVNKTIAKGQNTTFSISASGSGLTYKWQISTDNGLNFSDLSDGGIYSNTTKATMNITGAPLSINGYLYRCRVTATCPPVVYSDPASITVLPNVVTTCQTVTDCPGQIMIAVMVSDFLDVSAFSMTMLFNPVVLAYSGYQDLHPQLSGGYFYINAQSGTLFLDWSRISSSTIPNGDTLIRLLFNGVTGSTSLTWDTQTAGNCEYSNSSGQVIFSTWVNGSVTVYAIPTVTSHPTDKTTYGGGSATFSVSATGSGLNYQWQESTDGGLNWNGLTNTPPFSGVYTPTLTINPAATAMDGYLYRCRVTGYCPPVAYSDSAMLTVTPVPVHTTAVSITSSCTGNLVVPIVVTNCNNIGSISLTLNYDPTKLTFDSYQSVHSELLSGILVINPAPTQVKMSWASTVGANIGSGTLIEFRFTALPSISTSLEWDIQSPGNCEYSSVEGMVLTSFYTNGSVSVTSNPLIVDAGDDTSLSPGGSVQLNGSATGGAVPYDYLWSPSTGLSDPSIPDPIATPPSVPFTYTLTVIDDNGCSGSDVMKIFEKIVNIKVFLEGLYAGGGLMNKAYDEWGPHFGSDTADVVRVELHNTADYFDIVYAIDDVKLSTDGKIVLTGIPSIYNGAYYLTIRHRNSIETVSAEPVTLSGGIISYDFTTAASKAYMDNQKDLGDGYFAIWGGDTNQDGIVDSGDMNTVDNAGTYVIFVGYAPEDVNGDGIADSGDMNIVDNNTTAIIIGWTP